MNFYYSPVSNTRCHSTGHKMRKARIKIRVDSPGRWERAYGGNAYVIGNVYMHDQPSS